MTFSRRLKKNFGWLLSPFAALILLQSTQGIAQIVGARVGPAPGVLAADLTSSRRPPHGPSFHSTSAAAILAHNAFDSHWLARAREVPPESDDPAPISDPMDAPPCDGVTVRAIVSSADPEWSLATLEESESSSSPSSSAASSRSPALLRRRGSEVGDRRIEYIAWDRVWMTSATGLCQASMFAPRPQPEPARKVTTAQPVLAPPGPVLEPWILRGIETVGPTERNIDRGIIPRLLEKKADLIGPARALPEMVGGKIAGFRVTGVRPDSLLGTLGIVNGDRLQSINGFDLTDTQSALAAYTRLLQADHLVLDVNRGGQNVRLELNIR